MSIRPYLIVFHRWVGLIGALWLLALAVTGCAIVFYYEFDHALNPDLFKLDTESSQLPADTVVSVAEAHRPGSYASFIRFPAEPGQSVAVRLDSRSDSLEPVPDGTEILIHPVTAEVLAERVFGAAKVDRRHLMSMLYGLHTSLLLGDWMIWFLGLVSVAWMVSQIAGTIIAFKSRKQWQRSFQIRKGASGFPLWFDLHRATGLWLLPVTLMLAITGIYFNWPDVFRNTVSVFSNVTPNPAYARPSAAEPDYSPAVSLDDAIRITQETTGGLRVATVGVRPDKALYWFRSVDGRDVDAGGGRRWTFVDTQTGEVISDYHNTEGTAGDLVFAWQYPLHSGKAFGLFGRLIVLLAGVITAVQCVTGLLVWWRKRKTRMGRESARTRRNRSMMPAGAVEASRSDS